METPERFGVTREVTLNGQGGIQSDVDKANEDADAGEAEAPGMQNRRRYMNEKMRFNRPKMEGC